MTTLVSRNTIKLAASASAVDNYYNGHTIVLTRVDSLGKVITQTKNILDYAGGNKIATIDSLWDADFTPKLGDKYKIIPKHADGRVSINTAIQGLDYITSNTYGRGLDPFKDLKLDTWLESARICDTRSDIYVKFTGSAPSVGAVYTIGSAIWQGTVAQVTGSFIRFTDIIGKLSYKWNNWRDFQTGALVYNGIVLYSVTSGGIKTTAPTHTTGTTNGLLALSSKSLTKVSGTGPASIPLYVNGNPVRYTKDGIEISGYTLYDSDGIDYFRLIGWDVNDQRSVTRHQTNISIDTSLPLFDNMNSLLQHCGGILRYTGDKYVLEIEQAEGIITNSDAEPRNITSDHIIGKISISDDGIKNSYNSLTVSYSDPSNKFEARNISFFNSDFLKADRNVPKKGSVSIPGITNYYNARLLADKYLRRSRYGLTVNLNISPRGTLLLPGKVIQLQYPRYGWTNKKFRIENLTHNDDCTVDIVATEYDDSFYIVGNVSKAPAIGVAGNSAMTTLAPPSSLVTTSFTNGNELVSAIELVWQNSPGSDSPNVRAEVIASYSPNLNTTVDSITDGQTFTTLTPHNMVVGQKIISPNNINGLVKDGTYYIKDVTPTTFTLALTKDGPVITTFTNTTNDFYITTGIVIANVTPPTNTYTDTVFDITGTRVQKYYWIRYKINVQ